MMEQNSLKVNLILNYIKTIMGIVFPLISLPYASRILLTEGMGKVDFVASIIVYLQLIASLGIGTYAIREGTKLRNDKIKLSIFSSEMLIINFFSMIIAYAIMFIIILIPKFEMYRSALLIYGAVLFFGVMGVDWLYSILEDFKYITIRAVLFQMVSLVLLFILVKKPSDTNKYILITVISSAGSGVLNWVHSRRYIDWFAHLKKYKLKKHLKPILIIFGMTLATKVYLNMDVIMIGLFKSDHNVGLYSAAVKFNTVLSTIITAISGVMLPRLSLFIGQNKKDEFEKLVCKAMQYLLFATIPVIVGLFFVTPNMIVLFCGKAFAEASITMKIILPNLLCSILNGFIAYQIFMPCGKEKWSLQATVAGGISNLIMNCCMIPVLAQNGAAIATVLTEIVVFFVCLKYTNQLMDARAIFKGTWKYLCAAGSFGLVYILICVFHITSNILSIMIEVLIGGFGYLLLLLLLKNEFLIEILANIRRRKI